MGNKTTKRALASAAAMCLVLSSAPTFAAETTVPETTELSGKGRIQTAIRIAEEGWEHEFKGSKNAVLTAGADANLVDALAVSPLAYQLKAPILLNDAKDTINADTLKALKDNGVTKVYLATGDKVITDKAVAELKAEGIEVERLGGKNRYETAKNILDAFKENGGSTDNIALVTGNGLADALSVSSIAAKKGMPIVLTEGKDKVAAGLDEIVKAAEKVYAIGGNGVISDALVNEIRAERLNGKNRYETNAAVIKEFTNAKSLNFGKVYLANGQDAHLVDALTGSVLAAQTSSPIVLGDDKVNDKVAEALNGNLNGQSKLSKLGGAVNSVFVEGVQQIAKTLQSGFAGFVTDETGNAVKDAVVTVNGKTATTNGVGYYKLLDLPAGKYDVTVNAEGYAPKTLKDTVVVSDKLTTANVQLGAELVKGNIKVSGVIADAKTNAPIKDATVKLESADGKIKYSTSTSVAGAYTLINTDSNLEFGKEYKLTVAKEGYHEYTKTITLKSDATANTLDGIELNEIKAMTISGTVTGTDGKAVASKEVSILDAKGNEVCTAGTDAQGKFTIKDTRLLTGKYTLKVDTDVATEAVYTAELNVTEGTNLAKDVTLVKGYNVTFTLATEEVGGSFSTGDADKAKYTATLLKGETKVAEKTVEGIEGKDSTLKFDNINRVAPGTYTLRVSGNYIVTKDFQVTVGDKDVVSAGRAVPAGMISGTITNGKDAKVQLLNAAGAVIEEKDVKDADGKFEFGGIPAGTGYKVKVTKEGYVAKTIDKLTVKVDTNTEGAFVIEKVATTGSVSGYVRTTGTLAPASGAVVTYYAIDVKDKKAGEYIAKSVVDETGLYKFVELVPGSYKVVVRHAGKHETFVTTQTVVAGDKIENANYKLTTGGNAALNISIVDSNGKAVELDQASNIVLKDASEDAKKAGDDEVAIFTSADRDPVGLDTLKVDKLPAGTYSYTITAPEGYEELTGSITITAGETKSVKFTLAKEAEIHKINFKLLDENGSYVKNNNANVVIFNEDGSILNETNGVINAEGVATLEGMVDGTYTYYIFADGNVVVKGTVTVAGKDVTVAPIMLDAVK